MDTAEIVFAVGFVIVLVVALYQARLSRLSERAVGKQITVYASELQNALFILLGFLFAELGRAIIMVDWQGVLSFGTIALLIAILLIDLRHRSDTQSRSGLAAVIKSAVKEALKEDREENIASIKDVFKQALEEDREEASTDNESKRKLQ
jgi:DNA primase large subunit